MPDNHEPSSKEDSDAAGSPEQPSAFHALGDLLIARKAQNPTVTEDHVRSILASRRAREAAFGRQLFSDPAWDMILELYATSLAPDRMTLAELARSLDMPLPMFHRWTKALDERGVIELSPGPAERLSSPVKLSEPAAAVMNRLMDYWGSAFLTISADSPAVPDWASIEDNS